jgi:hypothetical protein
MLVSIPVETEVPGMLAFGPSPPTARTSLSNAVITPPWHCLSFLRGPRRYAWRDVSPVDVEPASSHVSTHSALNLRHRLPPTRAERIRPRRASRLIVASDTAARAAARRTVSQTCSVCIASSSGSWVQEFLRARGAILSAASRRSPGHRASSPVPGCVEDAVKAEAAVAGGAKRRALTASERSQSIDRAMAGSWARSRSRCGRECEAALGTPGHRGERPPAGRSRAHGGRSPLCPGSRGDDRRHRAPPSQSVNRPVSFGICVTRDVCHGHPTQPAPPYP